MNAYAKTVLIGSLLGAFILLGCDSSTDPGSSNSVAGAWKGKAPDSTMTLVFTGDSAFAGTLPLSYGTYTLAGKFKVTGNAISLKYASSLLTSPGISPEGVPPPTPDSVTGTLSGTKMTIPIPYDQNGALVVLSKQ
jgi:hypothetical protein